MTELIACPFCSGKNLRIVKLPIIRKDFQDFTMHNSHVECLDCGSDGPKMAFVEDVIQAWNNRSGIKHV